ncbi:uncharacterized protein M421DRAFT_240 [Didymella exigua CBS 183.55]|uniref:Vacuolar protein sorting-associated protein 62 n=1 Tax=Didymella exigua CBS 183.55 TaxID=1150837 RepID=A0A6A5S377_9PLEO|nr:uncharacterized protein M421DRAFT_240 [Didymella exigua CBS 183.55]KAF1934080.1 hypothetical protein M421DRAFT_240 [Didymella exigua CBS 183.55]
MIARSLYAVLVCLLTASLVACASVQQELRQDSFSIPDFVLRYAPTLYLHSEELYFPTDLTTFLEHVTPRANYTPVANAPNPLTLTNLDQLGAAAHLTSNDDVTTSPAWLSGAAPDSHGLTAGINCAVIVNTKNDSSADVFYFYFYAFNPGTNVFSLPFLDFGNHVGDWEHTMLRFRSPTSSPEAMWYSQHANGQAFRYSAVEKDSDGVRPVVYVAKGSHANYAVAGTHSHVIPNLNLPFGALQDYTDKGRRWDPIGSSWVYEYDAGSGAFTALNGGPVEWLSFKGKWGDEAYPDSDRRQVDVFGQKKYVGGPTGPADKQLDRKEVCPDNGIPCILRSILVPLDVEAGS